MITRNTLPALLALGAALLTAQGTRAQDDGMDGSTLRQAFGRGNAIRGTIVASTGTGAHTGRITVRTEEGDTYQVLYSANTRMMKEQQQPIEAGDIHVGDMLIAAGEVDKSAKTVGAVFVFDIDAEKVRNARAAFGKTWTAGKVTAIHDLQITIQRMGDKQTQVVTVDEDTSFRKQRESVTLADIKVGDSISARERCTMGLL